LAYYRKGDRLVMTTIKGQLGLGDLLRAHPKKTPKKKPQPKKTQPPNKKPRKKTKE